MVATAGRPPEPAPLPCSPIWVSRWATWPANWIELVESVELLRGHRPTQSEDVRELSLLLAGWMIHLGGQAATLNQGYARAEAALSDGSALRSFFSMIEAQGGDTNASAILASTSPAQPKSSKPGKAASISTMDTHRPRLGRAAHRAGREKAGEPVDPHAGIDFHARRGARLEKGQPFATLYATSPSFLAEPEEILKQAITFSSAPPQAVPLVSRIFTREAAEAHLRNVISSLAGNWKMGTGNYVLGGPLNRTVFSDL